MFCDCKLQRQDLQIYWTRQHKSNVDVKSTVIHINRSKIICQWYDFLFLDAMGYWTFHIIITLFASLMNKRKVKNWRQTQYIACSMLILRLQMFSSYRSGELTLWVISAFFWNKLMITESFHSMPDSLSGLL